MRRLTRLQTSGRASDLPRSADEVWAALVAAGPGSRWYVDAAPFVVRGALDRVVGGGGRRWPVPDRDRLAPGDRAGFWEVRTLDTTLRRLVLAAVVRAPGTVLLTSSVLPAPTGCELRQSVSFEPDGLLGTAYLLADLPAREVVVELAHRRAVAAAAR